VIGSIPFTDKSSNNQYQNAPPSYQECMFDRDNKSTIPTDFEESKGFFFLILKNISRIFISSV